MRSGLMASAAGAKVMPPCANIAANARTKPAARIGAIQRSASVATQNRSGPFTSMVVVAAESSSSR